MSGSTSVSAVESTSGFLKEILILALIVTLIVDVWISRSRKGAKQPTSPRSTRRRSHQLRRRRRHGELHPALLRQGQLALVRHGLRHRLLVRLPDSERTGEATSTVTLALTPVTLRSSSRPRTPYSAATPLRRRHGPRLRLSKFSSDPSFYLLNLSLLLSFQEKFSLCSLSQRMRASKGSSSSWPTCRLIDAAFLTLS